MKTTTVLVKVTVEYDEAKLTEAQAQELWLKEAPRRPARPGKPPLPGGVIVDGWVA